MTDEQIEAAIESIRVDAEHDIEDFRRLYLTLVVLKAQRDALAETLKARLSARCLWCGENHSAKDCLKGPAHNEHPSDFYLRRTLG